MLGAASGRPPTGGTSARGGAAAVAHRGEGAAKPNIIFFLADDMATFHLRHTPNTRRYVFAGGARFTNFYANVSLCCPSWASLLTRKYAHNTGIGGNEFPDGFHGFQVGDESSRTFAVALRRRAGYTTGLLGKYLNEYPFVESSPRNAVPRTFVPPGWSDWAVPISGQFYGVDYLLNRNGRILRKRGPRDYLGDLLARRALRKIEKNKDRGGPGVVHRAARRRNIGRVDPQLLAWPVRHTPHGPQTGAEPLGGEPCDACPSLSR